MQLKIEAGFQLPLRLAPPWFVMANRMDSGRTRFRRQFRQLVHRVPAPKDQPRAMPREVGCQRCERMVQPPAACRAHAAVTWRIVVQHVNRDHRAELGGGMKRLLIDKPQIAPQPYNLRFCQRDSSAFPL